MLPRRLLLIVGTTLCLLGPCGSLSEAAPAWPQPLPKDHDYFTLRGDLLNSRRRFEQDKVGRVAFLGGSITAMKGWRDRVSEELQKRFPDTRFDFIAAGIPSLGSTPHSFRLTRDVLQAGPIDLLFVEAAVNDSGNGNTDLEQVRGMEGIVRHVRRVSPLTDIVELHFVDPNKATEIREGKTPAVIANHERVADRYAVPSIDLAREVTERIDAGQFDWPHDFKSLHPSPFGHEVYASSILRLLDASWSRDPLPPGRRRAHPWPVQPLDAGSYDRGRLVPPSAADPDSAWTLVPSWTPADKVSTRAGFVDVPMLVAEKAGAVLKLQFQGNAVGILVVSGPDAGTLASRVDGGEWSTRDLFTRWSSSLHLPWAVVLAADLPEGSHELELRIADTAHPDSKGHALRIVHFLVNGPL